MRTFMGIVVAGVALAGCDYSGDWLFAGAVDGIPGVIDLGEVVPADVESRSDLEASTIYGQVGPTGTAAIGGLTFTFEGTGGHVCLWVDPELVYWNQSVAAQRPTPRWTYPDNIQDDGDLEISAGLATYYNGSPGEQIGDFEVRYQDALGNPVEIALNECLISTQHVTEGGHAGRGSPEFCTIQNTQPGVSYLALLETWSTPLDDDLLGFGIVVANGSCTDLQSSVSGLLGDTFECLVVGEGVDPEAANGPGPWLGLDAVPSYEGSIDFEEAFCGAEARMSDYCEAEADNKDCDDPGTRCFCGDPANTPSAGSF